MKRLCLRKLIINNSGFINRRKRIAPFMGGLLCLSTALFLSSCLSIGNPKFDSAPLLGMIYDTENLPCQGATIVLDGNENGQTDVNGRFVLSNVSNGKHTILVKKEGYENLTVPLNFIDRKEILYLKVISLKQLLAKTEENIEQKKMMEAEELLERARAIQPESPVLLYVNAIYYVKNEKNKEAVALLEHLKELGYKDPIIHLSLADLYEYKLFDYEKAVIALNTYLTYRPKPEVKERLARLVNDHNLQHLISTSPPPAGAAAGNTAAAGNATAGSNVAGTPVNGVPNP